MIHCVNVNDSYVQELSTAYNLTPSLVANYLGVWQTQVDSFDFPTTAEFENLLQSFVPSTQETTVYYDGNIYSLEELPFSKKYTIDSQYITEDISVETAIKNSKILKVDNEIFLPHSRFLNAERVSSITLAEIQDKPYFTTAIEGVLQDLNGKYQSTKSLVDVLEKLELKPEVLDFLRLLPENAVQVNFVAGKNNIKGSYNIENDTININLLYLLANPVINQNQEFAEVLAHEVIHATLQKYLLTAADKTLSKQLSNSQKIAYNNLLELLSTSQAVKEFKISSVSEMFAYLSDIKFLTALQKEDNRSSWRKLLSNILELFGVKSSNSSYNTAINNLQTLFTGLTPVVTSKKRDIKDLDSAIAYKYSAQAVEDLTAVSYMLINPEDFEKLIDSMEDSLAKTYLLVLYERNLELEAKTRELEEDLTELISLDEAHLENIAELEDQISTNTTISEKILEQIKTMQITAAASLPTVDFSEAANTLFGDGPTSIEKEEGNFIEKDYKAEAKAAMIDKEERGIMGGYTSLSVKDKETLLEQHYTYLNSVLGSTGVQIEREQIIIPDKDNKETVKIIHSILGLSKSNVKNNIYLAVKNENGKLDARVFAKRGEKYIQLAYFLGEQEGKFYSTLRDINYLTAGATAWIDLGEYADLSDPYAQSKLGVIFLSSGKPERADNKERFTMDVWLERIREKYPNIRISPPQLITGFRSENLNNVPRYFPLFQDENLRRDTTLKSEEVLTSEGLMELYNEYKMLRSANAEFETKHNGQPFYFYTFNEDVDFASQDTYTLLEERFWEGQLGKQVGILHVDNTAIDIRDLAKIALAEDSDEIFKTIGANKQNSKNISFFRYLIQAAAIYDSSITEDCAYLLENLNDNMDSAYNDMSVFQTNGKRNLNSLFSVKQSAVLDHFINFLKETFSTEAVIPTQPAIKNAIHCHPAKGKVVGYWNDSPEIIEHFQDSFQLDEVQIYNYFDIKQFFINLEAHYEGRPEQLEEAYTLLNQTFETTRSFKKGYYMWHKFVPQNKKGSWFAPLGHTTDTLPLIQKHLETTVDSFNTPLLYFKIEDLLKPLIVQAKTAAAPVISHLDTKQGKAPSNLIPLNQPNNVQLKIEDLENSDNTLVQNAIKRLKEIDPNIKIEDIGIVRSARNQFLNLELTDLKVSEKRLQAQKNKRLSDPHYIVYDLETTGLNENENEIIQFAWATYDALGNKLSAEEHWIEGVDEYIPQMEAGLVEALGLNLVENSPINKPRVPLETVKGLFQQALANTPHVVGHNIKNFDNKFILKAGINLDNVVSIDTMQPSVVKYMAGSSKSLVNIYETLFGKTVENAHQAAIDVQTNAAVFFELLRMQSVPGSAPFFNLKSLPPVPNYMNVLNNAMGDKVYDSRENYSAPDADIANMLLYEQMLKVVQNKISYINKNTKKNYTGSIEVKNKAIENTKELTAEQKTLLLANARYFGITENTDIVNILLNKVTRDVLNAPTISKLASIYDKQGLVALSIQLEEILGLDPVIVRDILLTAKENPDFLQTTTLYSLLQQGFGPDVDIVNMLKHIDVENLIFMSLADFSTTATTYNKMYVDKLNSVDLNIFTRYNGSTNILATVIKQANEKYSYTDDDGTPCAKFGMQVNFTPGHTWEILGTFNGRSHAQGGIDISITDKGVSFTNQDGKFKAKNGVVINRKQYLERD